MFAATQEELMARAAEARRIRREVQATLNVAKTITPGITVTGLVPGMTSTVQTTPSGGRYVVSTPTPVTLTLQQRMEQGILSAGGVEKYVALIKAGAINDWDAANYFKGIHLEYFVPTPDSITIAPAPDYYPAAPPPLYDAPIIEDAGGGSEEIQKAGFDFSSISTTGWIMIAGIVVSIFLGSKDSEGRKKK